MIKYKKVVTVKSEYISQKVLNLLKLEFKLSDKTEKNKLDITKSEFKVNGSLLTHFHL